MNDELPDDLLWDSGNSNGGLSNGTSSMDPMGGGGQQQHQQQQPPNNNAGPMMGNPGNMLRNPVPGGMGGGGMPNQQTMQNINLVNALNKPKANGPGGMVVVGGDMRTGGNSENNSLNNAMNSNSSLQGVGGGGANNAPPQVVSSMMGGGGPGGGLVSMAPVNAMSADLGASTVVSSMGGGGGQMGGPGGQMRPMGLQQQGGGMQQQQVMMNGPMVRHMSPMVGNNGLQQQQIRQPNLIGAVGQPRMINAPGVRMQAMVSITYLAVLFLHFPGHGVILRLYTKCRAPPIVQYRVVRYHYLILASSCRELQHQRLSSCS